MKGLNSRAFWKISLLADFGHFMEMYLNCIPLHPDFVFGSSHVRLVLLDSKFAIIMICYVFIAKIVTSNLEGLFRPFLKRDEPKIISNERK